MSQADLNRPRIGIGGIIRDGHGRTLMVERAEEPASGTWSFPGGSLEWGEPLEEGVRREVKEETSLEVAVLTLLYVAEMLPHEPMRNAPFHFVILDYGCETVSGFARAQSDARSVRWVTAAEAFQLPLTPGMQACLSTPEVRAFLGWSGMQPSAGP